MRSQVETSQQQKESQSRLAKRIRRQTKRKLQTSDHDKSYGVPAKVFDVATQDEESDADY